MLWCTLMRNANGIFSVIAHNFLVTDIHNSLNTFCIKFFYISGYPFSKLFNISYFPTISLISLNVAEKCLIGQHWGNLLNFCLYVQSIYFFNQDTVFFGIIRQRIFRPKMIFLIKITKIFKGIASGRLFDLLSIH